MRVLGHRAATPTRPSSTFLGDLSFWLLVAAVAAGVGILMWGTATGAY